MTYTVSSGTLNPTQLNSTSYIAPSNNKNKCNGHITNLSNTTNQSISSTMKDQFAVKQTWIVLQKQIYLM